MRGEGGAVTIRDFNDAEMYLEAVPHEKVFKAEEEAQMEKMWVVNQPKPHRWTIILANKTDWTYANKQVIFSKLKNVGFDLSFDHLKTLPKAFSRNTDLKKHGRRRC